MKGIAAVCAMAILLSGCWKKELTPEEKTLVSSLTSELQRTQQEIAAAATTSSSYSGGVIKLLADARAEILKTNQALLEQRIQSIETGAPVKIESVITAPNKAAAASIATEIEATKANIAASKAEADQFSGGLIHALKLSVVATQQQTLAMLEQKYLIAMYGLNPSTATAPLPVPSTPSALPDSPAQTKASIPAAAGPLGFAGGQSQEEIEGMTGDSLTVIDEAQNLYGSSRSPKPNAAFESFALVVSPTLGLCQIRAIGKTINTNRFGHQLQSDFDEMKEALTGAYGKPQMLDHLMRGSIWKEADDWMMGLYKKDRVLIAEWSASTATPLKNNLESIVMSARALGADSGYYMLQYSFTNNAACEAERKTKAQGSL